MLDLDKLIINNYLGDKTKCWLCSTPASNPSKTFEEHHIVPKHLGGKNGPLVFICSDCHKNVHDSATALLKGNSYLPYNSHSKKERCLSLASVIAKATLALKNNKKNKSYVYSTLLSYKTHSKLVALTKALSSKSNRVTQDDVVVLAIEELHKKILS